MPPRNPRRVFPIARSYTDGIEACPPIAHEMAFVDDKSAAEYSNGKVLFKRSGRRRLQPGVCSAFERRGSGQSLGVLGNRSGPLQWKGELKEEGRRPTTIRQVSLLRKARLASCCDKHEWIGHNTAGGRGGCFPGGAVGIG